MLPYWSIPPDAFDDSDLMAHWIRLAFDAGLRAQATKAPARRRGPAAKSHGT